ncbi:MAG: AraC family transcriptional regulator, partial [Planctomycetes bacterium]|nr:AraC family transcriptional regulator [Planctomycetota bacterium]
HTTFRQRSAQQPSRRPHVHDVYHLVLVTSGTGTFVIGDETVAISTGDLFLTSPGERHSFANAAGEQTEYCEVTLEFIGSDGRVLTRPFHEVLAAWSGMPCAPIARLRANAELHLAIMGGIEAMARAGFSQRPDYPLALAHGAAQLFMQLHTHALRAEAPASVDRLVAVQLHIQQHYRELLSLDQLSELCGFTPNYLSRRFKARFGATPIVYQHRLRIQAAANLLRTTDHPIREIAVLVGYHDVHVFTRSFRSHEGVPPGRYRKDRWDRPRDA